MTTFAVSGVRMAGVASAIPQAVRTPSDEAATFPNDNIDKLAQSTGVLERHVAHRLCASDLGEAAARRALAALEWKPETVDLLVFVTQTPDYRLPANACLLQARLGLPESCMAFDVSLGCSGFVYGLGQAASLVSSMGAGKRALLIVGDTISRMVSPTDKSTVFLFGDGAAAIALECDGSAAPMHFTFGTDGRGGNHLLIPAGGVRKPATPETAERRLREGGNHRSEQDLFMNGAEVFAFTLRVVPNLVQSTLAAAAWTTESVDFFLFHQANAMMLKHLGKKLGVAESKMPLSLGRVGNTSGASIPITMSERLRDDLGNGPRSLLMVGFGVGFSWGAAAVHTTGMAMPETVLVEEPAA
jgi:3-oxoacyl-[acyl-carrier-protein] synthase-3